MTLEDGFRRYIRDNRLVDDGDRVLLAVSGGVDSMVMLSLFVAAGYNVGVAHCNFQLRGRESDEDQVQVEAEAAKYDVPFYNMCFDTLGEMERTGESLQMAARRLRYAWFDTLCHDHGYNLVAVAHHLDDSIETFFINLFRGTGLRGLTGINLTGGRVVRPLLFATRREITEYAAARAIPYREDSSNRSTKYLRNKIRLGLIPRLREINPRFGDQMSVNIQRLTEAQLFVDRCMDRIARSVESEDGSGVATIDIDRVDAGLPVNFVIFELLKKYGFRGDVIDSLYKSLRGGHTGRRFYSRDRVAYIDRGRIVVAPIDSGDDRRVEIEAADRKAHFGGNVMLVDRIYVDDIETLQQPDNVVLLDRDKLHFPLTLRLWSDGDRFVPLGMEGHKLVSDLLIDEKVSIAAKAHQFVLCSGADIVWVVGRRMDDRYRITKNTENVLRLTLEPGA